MNEWQYAQALAHMNLHYGNDKGFIAFYPRVDGKLNQRIWPHAYARTAVVDLPADGDLYFSLNSFATHSRTAAKLWYLHAFYVDLDTMKAGLDPGEALETLEREYWGEKIPAPTYVILSGRGLWAVWTIQPAKNDRMRRTVRLWKETQTFLLELLQPFGADPTCNDVSRICRIAGSTNPKNGATVRLNVYHPHGRYSLSDLHDFVPKAEQPTIAPTQPVQGHASSLFWPARREDYTPFPELQSSPTTQKRSLLTPRTWLQAALSDLEELVRLRRPLEGDGRNNILFRYAVWQFTLTRDEAITLERSLSLNSRMGEPMPDSEVRSTTSSACKEWNNSDGKSLPRRFRTSKTVDVLRITPEEQRRMQVLISAKEKSRRDLQRKQAQRRANGIPTRAEMQQERMALVAEASRLHPEASVHRLAQILSMHPSTVKKYRGHLDTFN